MWTRTAAEMTITLYIIRHGATKSNKRHAYLGNTNEPLSNEGGEQIIFIINLEDIQKKKIIFLFSQVQCFDAFRQRIFCIQIQELFYFLNGRKLTLDALKEKIIRI